MRPAVPLVYLALWTCSGSAFYPFTPVWRKEKEQARPLGEDKRAVAPQQTRAFSLEIERRTARTWAAAPSERAAREAARLSSIKRALAKRENDFPIMHAADPREPMTSGIDQDGTDYAYFVKVQLGSKHKQLYMLVDTGAGSSWVMGSSCAHRACMLHYTFGPGDSDTLEPGSKDFSVSYGSGTVRGSLGTDTITLAGMSFRYELGLASKISDDFSKFAFDGILGLSMSNGANENFLSKITQARKLDSNIFCVSLSRASDGTNTGEIRFGSTNPDKYTGDITYTPLDTKDGEWAIRIDNMAYDGKKAQVGGVLSYIDTGTSFVFGPEDMVRKVHNIIPGAESVDGQTYTVPCDSDKSLTFTFSGVDFKVSPKDWISPQNSQGKCTSNIYGHEVAKGAWLLGDTFLMNVYTVFDKDQKRIGFANMASPNSDRSASEPATNKAPTRATATPGSSSHAAPSTGMISQAHDSQQSSSPTMGLGGHETGAGEADKAKETSKSAAAGGDSCQKAKLAATAVLTTLLVLAA